VVADNERAIRSYEKVGFRQEGKLREAVFVDGSYRDLLLMSILGREYQEGDKYD
jgi:RimJ/RimL family protein N-acetyltransferase